MASLFKYAQPGSISSGTLKTEDLLTAFHGELEWQIQRNGDWFSRPENFAERDRLNEVIGNCSDECWDDDGNVKDDEITDDWVSILQDELGAFAPPFFCYFGAHMGDGADFGYWIDFDAIDNAVADGEMVKVDEFPGEDAEVWNGAAYACVVNDHGNMTIYDRMGNEIVSCV